MHVKPLSYSAVGGEWSQLHAELTGIQLWTSQLIRGNGSEQVSRGNGQCHSLPLQTELKLCNQYDELRGKLGIFYAGDVLDCLNTNIHLHMGQDCVWIPCSFHGNSADNAVIRIQLIFKGPTHLEVPYSTLFKTYLSIQTPVKQPLGVIMTTTTTNNNNKIE